MATSLPSHQEIPGLIRGSAWDFYLAEDCSTICMDQYEIEINLGNRFGSSQGMDYWKAPMNVTLNIRISRMVLVNVHFVEWEWLKLVDQYYLPTFFTGFRPR